MADAAQQIDALMEQASAALVAMRYAQCEKLCVEAMDLARTAEDFERLGRIMLPLQEARRQRRQAAEDAGTVVLTGQPLVAGEILDRHPRGCLLLTDPPYSRDDASALRDLARQRELFVEVLRLDDAGLTAAFCHAMENNGDAAVAHALRESDPVARVDALLGRLDQIGDHEIAHQRLADAARAAAKSPSTD